MFWLTGSVAIFEDNESSSCDVVLNLLDASEFGSMSFKWGFAQFAARGTIQEIINFKICCITFFIKFDIYQSFFEQVAVDLNTN